MTFLIMLIVLAGCAVIAFVLLFNYIRLSYIKAKLTREKEELENGYSLVAER